MDKYKFGNKICKLREEHNLTQKQLAEILDVSDKAVSKWENGQSMPRIETLEKMANTLDTSVEMLLSANKENSSRIYIINNYCDIVHIEIDGHIYSIKGDEGLWVDVDAEHFEIDITGDFSFNFFESNEKLEFKDKLILKAGKKVAEKLFELMLQADCKYDISGYTDNTTLTINFDCFSLGDKALTYQDFLMLYPAVNGENTTVTLLEANGKNSKEIIKKFKKLGLASDIGMDFMSMLLFYPLRGIYFRHLCKPKTIQKNILKADKYKADFENKRKNKKHGCLITFLIIIFIVTWLIFISPVLSVESDKPALISSDYNIITLHEKTYVKTNDIPSELITKKALGSDVVFGARVDGLSKWKQAESDSKVQLLTDENGIEYLWLINDYTENMYDENGEYKHYDDFDNHEIYIIKN